MRVIKSLEDIHIGCCILDENNFFGGGDLAIIERISNQLDIRAGIDIRYENVFVNAFTRDLGSVSRKLSEMISAGLKIMDISEYRDHMATINKERLESIQEYINVSREIFPGKAVTKCEDNGQINMYILIDEETVVDDNGLSTVVKDLVFKIGISDNGERVHDLSAQVYKADTAKIKTSYSHSHISKTAMTSWGSCCLGVTALSDTYGSLRLSLNIDTFELFLYQLKDYVRHESISGGPYTPISSIKEGRSRVPNEAEINMMYERLIDGELIPKVNISLTEGLINCTYDRDSLSECLIKAIIPESHVGRISNGIFQYNNHENNSDTSNFTSRPPLNVRDDVNEISLIKTVDLSVGSDSEMSSEKYVSESFMKNYELMTINKINTFITYNLIENARIKRKSEINNK